MGALAAARFHFERGDLKDAKAQLQWVVERSPSDELRDLARLRLAAVLLDEKAYDEALKLLEAKHAEAAAAQYAALKGDILVAKNQPAEAKAAYKLALEKSADATPPSAPACSCGSTASGDEHAHSVSRGGACRFPPGVPAVGLLGHAESAEPESDGLVQQQSDRTQAGGTAGS